MNRDRAARLTRFAIVGASGLVVNTAVLWFATEIGGLHYLLSAVIATQCSTLWNFLLTELWVFGSELPGRVRRLAWFAAMNNAWLLVRGPFMVALTDGAGINYVWSNLIVLCSATVVRFAVADLWIWAERAEQRRVRLGQLGFAYDIHGIVRVASEARLPELDYFRVESLDTSADIEIRRGTDGFGGFRRHAVASSADHRVSYVEHLGRWGFGMRVDIGERLEVVVTPTVLRSPHVLYTNVVEPLLRWTFVPKGYALVHAACLEIDGRGTLITAETDTGKTTTCLMSVQHHGTGFVSDDMVLIDRRRNALTFPKPLTISAHTLRAARTGRLPFGRRLWLQVQSRLHSRSGRRTGLAISRWHLPVCTMNAWVQRIVPPPKFAITELIPEARIVRSIPITHMGVIERGSTLVRQLLDVDENVAVLRANTEDAYGFPPYPQIASALANGHAKAEDELRRSLLDGLAVTRIRTSDRHWYEQLLIVATEAPFALQAVTVVEPPPDEVVVLGEPILDGGLA